MSGRLNSQTGVIDSGALNQCLLLLGQIGETGNIGALKGFAGVVTLVLDICNVRGINVCIWSLGHVFWIRA